MNKPYKNKRILICNPPAFLFNPNRHFVLSGSRWAFSMFGKPHLAHDRHYMPYPFSLGYAFTFLKNLGYDVYAIDFCAYDMNEFEFKSYVINLEPDIVVMDVPTIVFSLVMKLISEVKKHLPNTEFWIGGSHVTALPDLKNHPNIDKILPHELERSLLKVLGEDDIPFKYYPFTNRTEFPNELYSNFEFYTPSSQMLASKGCTNSCTFCVERHVIYENNQIRLRKPLDVVLEMEYCKNLSAKQIHFDDMDLTINEYYLRCLCYEFQSVEFTGRGLPWTCLGGVGLDNELVGLMSESNCLGLAFGVETITPKAQLFAKRITKKEIKDFTKVLRNHNIFSVGTFTLGLPHETKESLKKNIEFAVYESGADSVQFSITTPFPGTPLYKYLNMNGYLLSNRDWTYYDGSNFAVMDYPNLNHNEIEELFHYAMDLRKSQNLGFRK